LLFDINHLKSALIDSAFISDIIYLPEINSTNAYAKIQDGDKDNLLIITDYQTEGRGRYGRIWQSEPDKNLTFSIKKKFDITNKEAQYINFFFTYCTIEALDNFLSENNKEQPYDLELKWPNDILLNGKKLSGFLIQEDSSSGSYVIGCGLNVNQTEFSKDFEFKTTSLKIVFNKEFIITCLLEAIIKKIDELLPLLMEKRFDEIFNLWTKYFNMRGKEIVYTNNAKFIGKAKVVDIQKDGGLQIIENEVFKVIYSGDIRILYQN
jgi:BirA family biotin operon repressor/biotin-[acetyl-CoA-carboxylase] ligase